MPQFNVKYGYYCHALCIIAISIISPSVIFCAETKVEIGKTSITLNLKSIKDLRDQGVIKQGYEYSCGAAALATLLSHGIGDTVSEEELLVHFFKQLSENDEAFKEKEGLNLLDLQLIAQEKGYNAQGFKLTPENLALLKQPVIVFIKPNDFAHFSVLKAIRNNRVYLADPSVGNVRLPVYKFLDMWLDENGKGIILIVEKKDGRWTEENQLKVSTETLVQPELLTIREMIEVGSSYSRHRYRIR